MFFCCLTLFSTSFADAWENFSVTLDQIPPVSLQDQNLKARIVELQGQAVYTNGSPEAIPEMIHHFTLPAQRESYQMLLSIRGEGFDHWEILPHKNGIDHYLKLTFALPPRQTVTLKVTYQILIVPLDYQAVLKSQAAISKDLSVKTYLLPTKWIESDAEPFLNMAQHWKSQEESSISLAQKAYEFPARHLKYKPQPKAMGALFAYQTREGDCTEYAALFIALCRAMGIPARFYSVFNLGENSLQEFSVPNHTLSEIYLEPTGWIPVDPNLGFGKNRKDHVFGKTSHSLIYFQREGSWVWGNHLPKKKPGMTLPQVKIFWTARVLQEGDAESLIQETAQKK